MNDSRLSPAQVKNMFSEATFERGKNYYNIGRVMDLHYYSKENTWFAKVIGSDVYDVTVEIAGTKVLADCDCPAHYQYGQCKHMAAVMLGILDEQPDEPSSFYQKNEQLEAVNQFINVVGNYQQSETYSQDPSIKQALLVEFIIKTQPNYPFRDNYLWTIEMKIGMKRTYVVKNLRDFLVAIEKQRPYKFTKNFTYDPLEHIFAKEDFDIIQLLMDVCKTEAVYKKTTSYLRGAVASDERATVIPPMLVEKLLSMMENADFTFEHEGEPYNQIAIVENEVPFSFQLDKGKEQVYNLDVNELFDIEFFALYGYMLKEGILYNLSLEQQNFLSEFLSIIFPSDGSHPTDGNFLSIASEQMDNFLSVVIPEVKKLGGLKISEEVSNQIRQFPLHAKVMVDREEEGLHVDVGYHYGDVNFNPFQTNQSDKSQKNELIIRDTRKELEIMAIMENASLKFNGKQLYVEGEEAMYDFLYHTLVQLEDKADIFMTNNVKMLLLPEKQAPVTSFDFDSSGNFLEFTFDMNELAEADVQNILQSVIEKKKYYRLPNGTFVSIEENEQFQTVQQLFSDLKVSKTELEDGVLQLPTYRALQVDEVINNGDKSNTRIGKQFRKLIQNLKNPDELDFEVPNKLDAELRDYQEFGFRWLKTLAFYGLGGVLADDMGLGKTLQAIVFLLSEKEESQVTKPALVVAPASLVYNWKAEFQKFAPDLDAEVVIGTPGERQALLESQISHDVLITSYPLLRQDFELYKNHTFDAFFLDEAQAIKNHVTKTSKAVRGIKAHKRFALSGTPIENSLDELWALFDVILPGFFPSQSLFRKLSSEKVSNMARPFILRRVKKDVLKELPDKIETTHISDLTKPQKELYVGYLEKIQQETKESLRSEGFDKNRMKILAGLTRLRQLCCHPSLFIENYTGESGKLEQLLELVGNAKENGKRMLIFSQFTSMLDIIREELTKRELGFFYLDGKTTSRERVNLVERYNQGEQDIFLISLKAGGTGLNLTGADTVILYDLWWNPAVEEQAAGRAHRMGQKNVVQVIRLLTRGTIEEKIYELQQRKKELIEKVVQPGETMLTSLSEQEIKELLSI